MAATHTTAYGKAADIMDEACLPETLIKNGVDKALRKRIEEVIEATYAEAHECGRQCGRDDLQRELRALIGAEKRK